MVDELHNEDVIETQEKEETMEEMMQQYDVMGDFHRGKVVEGTIVDTQEDGWLVDVGYKCEGFLPRKEWTHRVLVEETPEPQNGDKVRVQITNINQGEDAQLGLSRWRCEFDERWNKLEEEAENNETINVKGLRKVKGGLIVNCCGIEGFIPISHLTQEGRGVNPGKPRRTGIARQAHREGPQKAPPRILAPQPHRRRTLKDSPGLLRAGPRGRRP